MLLLLLLLLDVGHYGTDCAKSLDQDNRPHLLQGTGYTTRAKVGGMAASNGRISAVTTSCGSTPAAPVIAGQGSRLAHRA